MTIGASARLASALQSVATMGQSAFKRSVASEPALRPDRSSERVSRRAKTILPPSDALDSGDSGLLDRFETLQSLLTIRVLGLESRADEIDQPSMRALVIGYMRTACELRELLARVLVIAPAHLATSETQFIESLRWAYFWAIEQLEAVHGQLDGSERPYTNTIPRDALSIFHEMARSMGNVKRGESQAPSAKETLLALDETLFRMMQMQDWISEVAPGDRCFPKGSPS
jgi:hypothetical protein